MYADTNNKSQSASTGYHFRLFFSLPDFADLDGGGDEERDLLRLLLLFLLSLPSPPLSRSLPPPSFPEAADADSARPLLLRSLLPRSSRLRSLLLLRSRSERSWRDDDLWWCSVLVLSRSRSFSRSLSRSRSLDAVVAAALESLSLSLFLSLSLSLSLPPSRSRSQSLGRKEAAHRQQDG